jgi:hypothetical protein
MPAVHPPTTTKRAAGSRAESGRRHACSEPRSAGRRRCTHRCPMRVSCVTVASCAQIRGVLASSPQRRRKLTLSPSRSRVVVGVVANFARELHARLPAPSSISVPMRHLWHFVRDPIRVHGFDAERTIGVPALGCARSCAGAADLTAENGGERTQRTTRRADAARTVSRSGCGNRRPRPRAATLRRARLLRAEAAVRLEERLAAPPCRLEVCTSGADGTHVDHRVLSLAPYVTERDGEIN